MIARLTGELVASRVDRAIVEVGGVGYLVWLGARLAGQLSEGQRVTLYISTQVREDAITLFGFESSDEQEAFEKMLGVSGVGPKVAMAILGTLTLPQVSEAVERDDTSTLGSVPGIGPKRRGLLLRKFGSARGVREAPVEEVAAVPGMTVKLATKLKEYL